MGIHATCFLNSDDDYVDEFERAFEAVLGGNNSVADRSTDYSPMEFYRVGAMGANQLVEATGAGEPETIYPEGGEGDEWFVLFPWDAVNSYGNADDAELRRLGELWIQLRRDFEGQWFAGGLDGDGGYWESFVALRVLCQEAISSGRQVVARVSL